jgi:hypothetical protein
MDARISVLLELVDEFPKRGAISYEEDDDRRFCNAILIALKLAAPKIRVLATSQGPIVDAEIVPSNEAPASLPKESSIRIPSEKPALPPLVSRQVVTQDGISGVWNHIKDISDKPEVAPPTVVETPDEKSISTSRKTLPVAKARKVTPRKKRAVSLPPIASTSENSSQVVSQS